MRSYFDSEAMRQTLLYHAGLWMGTPWCANSAAKGERGGVSCHNLPRQIYVECGALAKDFPVVVGSPAQSKHNKVSVIEQFIDSREEFWRMRDDEVLLPGDLIGIRICRCVDHLGVVLNDNSFVHVLMHKRTCADSFRVPPWSQRILAKWRINI